MEAIVEKAIESYPAQAKTLFVQLRQIILQVAEENSLGLIEESLKWGEPSYLAKGGSAVRIGWKSKFPDQCFVFFNCQTSLVETFKEIYGDVFRYEGNRAIVCSLSQNLPEKELKHCLFLSLQYHKLKHLPLLGA